MKKILPILFIALFAVLRSNGQEARGPVQDQGSRYVKLYPNPATAYVTFDLQKNYQKGLTITVFSFLGKKMTELPNAPEKTVIELADFNRGMYIYHLTDANGKVIDSGKFQVSR